MAAEHLKVPFSSAGDAVDIAADVSSDGASYQLQPWVYGPEDGVKTSVDDLLALPVGGPQLGATNESAAASDTATSGMNGLLKRIAQRFTTSRISFTSLLHATQTISVVMNPGDADTPAVDCRGYTLIGYAIPATFDGEFAGTPPQASFDGITWFTPRASNGVPVAIAGGAGGSPPGRAVVIPATLANWPYIRLKGGVTITVTCTIRFFLRSKWRI